MRSHTIFSTATIPPARTGFIRTNLRLGIPKLLIHRPSFAHS
jgi:hypothetical protein